MRPRLSITQGDDRTIDIELSVPVAEIARVWLTAKTGADVPDDQALFLLSTDAGSILLGAQESTLAEAHLPGSATKTADPGKYLLECQVERVGGSIETAAAADLILVAEVTRAT